MAVRAPSRKEKTRKPVEKSDEFIKLMKDWQGLEDDTIKYAEDMMKKSRNPLIRMSMEMIRNDSQKHKAMQQMLIDSLTKEPVHLSIDELSELSDGLNRHMAAEAKSLELADEAMAKSELFITRYILSMLISDETKHHRMLANLNDLKRKTILVT